MSDKRRDDTGDTEPVGGRLPPPTEFGDVVPYGWHDGTRPVLPIGKDDEPDDDREERL